MSFAMHAVLAGEDSTSAGIRGAGFSALRPGSGTVVETAGGAGRHCSRSVLPYPWRVSGSRPRPSRAPVSAAKASRGAGSPSASDIGHGPWSRASACLDARFAAPRSLSGRARRAAPALGGGRQQPPVFRQTTNTTAGSRSRGAKSCSEPKRGSSARRRGSLTKFLLL